MPTETVELRGHIIDSLLLPKVLDTIIGRIGQHGAVPVHEEDARLVPADCDGAFPDGFYCTTHFDTWMRRDGAWIAVEQPEMDCGIAFDPASGRAAGQRVLVVAGPAVIHTGSGGHLQRLIEAGYVQVLFAGNALAAHDIEQALFGTSLGMSLAAGVPVEEGHEHHLRAINAIRRVGGIRQAVERGLLSGGIMHACVTRGVEYVLAGSIRDDGPLPDVITDVVRAQDAMREKIRDVTVAILIRSEEHTS